LGDLRHILLPFMPDIAALLELQIVWWHPMDGCAMVAQRRKPTGESHENEHSICNWRNGFDHDSSRCHPIVGAASATFVMVLLPRLP
jgi:hypothetical protein